LGLLVCPGFIFLNSVSNLFTNRPRVRLKSFGFLIY